jgi:hypothetical protein
VALGRSPSALGARYGADCIARSSAVGERGCVVVKVVKVVSPTSRSAGQRVGRGVEEKLWGGGGKSTTSTVGSAGQAVPMGYIVFAGREGIAA